MEDAVSAANDCLLFDTVGKASPGSEEVRGRIVQFSARAASGVLQSTVDP